MSNMIYNWLDERTGIKEYVRKKKGLPVPKHTNVFYCFGGLSFFIILLQILTGIYMLYYFIPMPEKALRSVEHISNDVRFGWLFRNMHRWGATLLIAMIFSHMVSIFYHRAFRRPRELNWLTGVFQFLVVFFLLVTGIIAPWNWRSYWSFAIWFDYIRTWPLIGDPLSEFLITNFSVHANLINHVWVLPVILFILLFFHFKMVKRHGISGPL